MNRPNMIGQATGHGGGLLAPTRLLGLVKVRESQGMMHHTEVVNCSQEKDGGMDRVLAFGRMTTAACQNGQTFAKGSVEPFNVGGIDPQAAVRGGQLLGHKGGGAPENPAGQAKGRYPLLGRVLDDNRNAQGRPDLQAATANASLPRHLRAECPQNGVRISGPAIGNDQNTAVGLRTAAHASQQAVRQAPIPVCADHAPQPQARADHQRHAQPEDQATAFPTNFVGLDMFQRQCFLFNHRLMHPFTVPPGAVTPIGYRALIQAIRLHNRLDRTAVDQQGDDNHHHRAVAAQPRKHRTLPRIEGFSAAFALIPLPLAPVAYDIPGSTFPSCFTLKIGAKYFLSVLWFSFCHGKQSLHQERFFFKFARLYHLLG